ncbi:MAG: sucrase ferredoxin, partial [Polyangiaceae bacterium]
MELEGSCSEQSISVGERLTASALQNVGLWVLIEVDGRWPARVEEAKLPAQLSVWLERLRAVQPTMRLQFIRQPRREGSVRVMSMLRDGRRRIRAFVFDTLERVASLPIEAIVGDDALPVDPSCEAPDSLFLVCTHGRRDRCCAKHGVAVYTAIEEHLKRGEVWQCSHLGGHRFAATVLHLPTGNHYGRLRVEHVGQLLDATREGRIVHLEHYRGCTDVARPAQAGEAWLREQFGELGFTAVQHCGAEQQDGVWECRFAMGQQYHHVHVRQLTLEVLRGASCGEANPTPVSIYEVVRHGAYMGKAMDEAESSHSF